MNHLIEVFELHGNFWLPGNPRRRLQGTLKYSPAQGVTLDINGAFGTDDDFSTEIILGKNIERTSEVTLYKCNEVRKRWVSNVPIESSFNVEIALLGKCVRSPEKIKFRNICVKYTQLDKWANISAFHIEHEDKKEIIEYSPPEPFKSSCNPDYTIVLNFGYREKIGRNEVSIRNEPIIEIHSEKEKSFNEFWKIIRQIQVFLSFAVGQQASPIGILGEMEIAKHRIRNRQDYYWPITIYYHVSLNAFDTTEENGWHDVLFWLSDIKDVFDGFIKNWLNGAELLEPIYNLYFIAIGSDVVLENKFLITIQAIEGLHRRLMDKLEWSNEENQELINLMKDTIDLGEKKEKILNYLYYANKFSLRSRLNDILTLYSNILPKTEIDNQFVDKVKNTRDYLTHYSKELEDKAAKGKELWILGWRLRIILEICLLKEIGFDLDRIKELVFKMNWRRKMFEEKI